MPPDQSSTSGYVYSRLTAAVDDKHSPLRRYLDTTYPNTRAITTPYSRTSPPLLVPGGEGVNPGTIGTAFDVLVGLRYQPDTVPRVARAFARWNPDTFEAWARVLDLVARDHSLIGAASWAYALAVEAYRSPVMPYDLDDLINRPGGYDENDLLGLAPANALDELARLDDLAASHLYPHLGTPPPRDPTLTPDARAVSAWTNPVPGGGSVQRVFAPTFAASVRCAADADLINARTLYELKTRLGAKRPGMGRVDTLPRIDLYQLITYALFDTSNEYDIDTVAIYSARYGRHTDWPLNGLLETLAGRPVHVASERARTWALLD